MEPFKYPEDWSYEVAESCSNGTIVRAQLIAEKESFSWVAKFGNLNCASWILNHKYRSNEKAKRYISHRRWVCQHNSHGKIATSKRNTGCLMSIDIKIKIITRKTKDTDRFLKLVPPLQALIKIEGAHNHPIDAPETLRLLRVSDETKAQYEEYFKIGLHVQDAIRCHEARLRSSGAAEIDFDDTSKNPTRRMVQHIYDNYKNQANSDHNTTNYDHNIIASPSTSTADKDEINVNNQLMQASAEEARLKFIHELRAVRWAKFLCEQEKFEPTGIDLKLLALEKKELADLKSFKTQEQYLAYKIRISRLDFAHFRRGGMMKVQPSARVRHRKGLLLGTKRQANGWSKKRPHNININIGNNESSAESQR